MGIVLCVCMLYGCGYCSIVGEEYMFVSVFLSFPKMDDDLRGRRGERKRRMDEEDDEDDDEKQERKQIGRAHV